MSKKTKTVTITATRSDGSIESLSNSPATGKALTRESAVAACDKIDLGNPSEDNPIVALVVTQGKKVIHKEALPDSTPVVVPEAATEELPADFAEAEAARKAAKAAKAEAKSSKKSKGKKPRRKASFDPDDIPAGLMGLMPTRLNAIPKGARAAGIKAIRDARPGLVKGGKVLAINEAKYANLVEKVRADHPKCDTNIIAWCATAVNIGAYPVNFEAEAKKRAADEEKAAKAQAKATPAKATKKAAPAAKARKAKKASKKAAAAA